jgi:hypothetical protein
MKRNGTLRAACAALVAARVKSSGSGQSVEAGRATKTAIST